MKPSRNDVHSTLARILALAALSAATTIPSYASAEWNNCQAPTTTNNGTHSATATFPNVFTLDGTTYDAYLAADGVSGHADVTFSCFNDRIALVVEFDSSNIVTWEIRQAGTTTPAVVHDLKIEIGDLDGGAVSACHDRVSVLVGTTYAHIEANGTVIVTTGMSEIAVTGTVQNPTEQLQLNFGRTSTFAIRYHPTSGSSFCGRFEHANLGPLNPDRVGCGDGVVAGAESCDDNNWSSNDGCSSACLIENGVGGCTLSSQCDDTDAACISNTCVLQLGEGFCEGHLECEGTLGCGTGGICGANTATCSGNGDCLNTCIGGTCANEAVNGGACDSGDNADCAVAGAVCDSTTNTCRIPTGDGTCSAAADCQDSDAECVSNTCVLQLGEGVCADHGDCEDNLGCGTGGICGANTATCSANGDCLNTCIAGVCDSDAANGGACDSGDNADCAIASAVCDSTTNTCRIPTGDTGCTADANCQDGDAACVSSTCVLQLGEGTCTADDDCEGNLECGAGVCGGNAAGCSANNECVNTCISGTCANEAGNQGACDSGDDADCSVTGAVCDSTTNTCRIPTGDGTCSTAADCQDSDADCISNVCVLQVGEGTCTADDDCEGTASCGTGGICGANTATCNANDDCVNTCIGSTCADEAGNQDACDSGDDADCSVTGAVCDSTTNTCRIPTGAGNCTVTADCADPQAVCDVTGHCTVTDTDEDGVANAFDLDSDGDGIADLDEVSDFMGDPDTDTDSDLVPDWNDPDHVPGGCDDALPMDSVCDTLPEAIDADGDGFPNHLDLDSDGDGLTDALEAGLTDTDGDGASDDCVAVDLNGTCTAGALNADAPNSDELAGDMDPDFLDADSDGDGVSDLVEAFDADGDGVEDVVPGDDADGDGLADGFDPDEAGSVQVDPTSYTSGEDSDGNGTPDWLQLCLDGYLTVDEVCDDGDADDGNACSSTCFINNGYGTCTAATDCQDGNADCVSGLCVLQLGETGCAVDADCEGDIGCFDGTCGAVDASCASNADCLDTCVANTCVPLSVNRDVCDAGDDADCSEAAAVCDATTDTCLVPTGTMSCAVDLDCQDSDAACVSGSCVLQVGEGACTTDDDCEGDLDCGAGGICGGNTAGCNANSECVNTCIAGVCADEAGNQGACDDGDTSDCADAAAVCDATTDTCRIPLAGGCAVDADCLSASANCVANTCVLPLGAMGCSTDAECEGNIGCADGTCGADGASCVANGDCLNSCVSGTCENTDRDGDGVRNSRDTDPDDDTRCQDADGDGCDDCRRGTASGMGGNPANDGKDTDGDGVCDGGGVELDLDDDGIPNADEGDGDFDGDGIDNLLDLDSDGDGISDLMEAGGVDSDGDGRVDDKQDENGDGLHDPLQKSGDALPLPDSDEDGAPDYVDTDDDDDSLPTELELADAAEFSSGNDTDDDGTPNYLDRDSDADGMSDELESQGDGDANGNGVPDYIEPFEPASPEDTDGDGILDVDECRGEEPCPDTDGDGVPDNEDPDDDNDDIPTATEVEDGARWGNDVDGDGIANWLDSDSDNDGLADGNEDSDPRGRPDYLEPGGFAGGALCAVGQPGASSGASSSALLLLLGLTLLRRRSRRRGAEDA